MFEYVGLAFNICFLVLFFVIYRSLRFDPQDILTSLQKSDAGVASGTSRQKKKADELIGEVLLESYPIVKQLATRWPTLGKFCQDTPNMVPYVAQAFASIMGGVSEKLPPELQPLIQALLGAQTPKRQPTRSTETGFR